MNSTLLIITSLALLDIGVVWLYISLDRLQLKGRHGRKGLRHVIPVR